MATKTLDKDQILEAIDTMTVLELSELVKAFEDRYGVTAAAPVAVAAAGAPAAGGDGAAAATEEQTEFEAVLTGELDVHYDEVRAILEGQFIPLGRTVRYAHAMALVGYQSLEGHCDMISIFDDKYLGHITQSDFDDRILKKVGNFFQVWTRGERELFFVTKRLV